MEALAYILNPINVITTPDADPVLGADGYPHVVEIARVKVWPVENMADLHALMAYVRDRWKYPDYWAEGDETDEAFRGNFREYRVSTGGWSGNEDLVSALEANMMWSMIAPWEWRRGGHYVWRIPYDR